MSSDQHREAIRGYDDALASLYGLPVEAIVAATAEARQEPAADDARVEQVVRASEVAGDAASSLLESDDDLVREMGEAQLAALAARDFAVAYDIARLDPDEGATVASAEVEGPALPEIERELAFVLSADPGGGVPISGNGWEGMAASASADEDPHKLLESGLHGGIDKVRDATDDVVKDGLKRLGEIGVDAALGQAAGKLLEQLPDGVRRWWRWAVEMFRRGVEKLMKLFGPLFEKAVGKVGDWGKEHGIDNVLDFAYGSKGLKADLSELVQKAADDKDLAAVGKSVERVVGKYETQKKVLLVLFKGLAFCRRWILRLIAAPQGEAVVAGAFGLGIGYTVFSGGDYLDWRRTEDEGFFDFVKGIRRTAEEGLG